METLLQISSGLSPHGESNQLASRFVAGWQTVHPRSKVIVRDLAEEPVPHLDAARFGAFVAKPEDRTPEQVAVVAYSDRLIEELKRADVVVLALPMYNFGVPSTLKAYFDHIARAGVTFRHTETGTIGLLTRKRVYVFAARGGFYAGTPRDTQTPYIRDFLGFIGMTHVEFVYAEGLAIAGEKEQSLARAQAYVDRLSALERAAA